MWICAEEEVRFDIEAYPGRGQSHCSRAVGLCWAVLPLEHYEQERDVVALQRIANMVLCIDLDGECRMDLLRGLLLDECYATAGLNFDGLDQIVAPCGRDVSTRI